MGEVVVHPSIRGTQRQAKEIWRSMNDFVEHRLELGYNLDAILDEMLGSTMARVLDEYGLAKARGIIKAQHRRAILHVASLYEDGLRGTRKKYSRK